MNVLQKLVCAALVFLAYCKLGYYHPWEIGKAVKAFFSEEKKLKAEVLSVKRFGIPIGTLMCSKDRGWLPIDLAFRPEMDALRELHGDHIGYLGKFAIIPPLQGKLVGTELLRQAVTKWSFDNDVLVVVMMVNPKHVRMYEKRGAKVLARSEGTKGLEKAPAVLMIMVLDDSEQAKNARIEYLHEQNQQPTLQQVAA